MSEERQFPVHPNHRVRGFPRTVPWRLLAPHEARAERNHDQSLETLARRGGLDPWEMAAVLLDKSWRDIKHLSCDSAAGIVLDCIAALAPEAGETEGRDDG